MKAVINLCCLGTKTSVFFRDTKFTLNFICNKPERCLCYKVGIKPMKFPDAVIDSLWIRWGWKNQLHFGIAWEDSEFGFVHQMRIL